MVQQGLSLQKVRLLPVPILDVQFQKYIKHTINVAYNTQTEAKLNYERAQTLILSELGLLDWKPKHSLSFVKNYSDTKRAGRCDAEYFQPKYTEILEIIEKNSQYTCRISSIQNYNARGLQPAYNPDGTLNVISSRHILETDLDYDKFERTNCSNWTDQRRARVYKGDILTYTTGANIGRTAVYNSNIPALASNHVNILRIDNENPEYIGFVMNSIIGRLQTERLSAGSAQAELYPKDIENFVIPFIALDKQNEVIGKIIQSRLMKHKSKYILESAKKAVEMAIEKDEKTAMQWLKNQIDNTGRDN
ncbi:MAG: restriction endonuclease subunit S [Thermodesulfovibrionia bacterium]|nr:restriction endonuclease subunit S [Thermodesulfovibrionia bacterium]